MSTSKLGLIIKNEYKTDISSKSFWIATFIVPILYVGFGFVMGILMAESDVASQFGQATAPDESDLTGFQVMGMLCGLCLALFLMIYGAQIYSKVRKEKVNRIMEVLATSVTGRTMMLGKIISVFLIGLTQLGVWILFGVGGILLFLLMAAPDTSMEIFSNPHLYIGLLWTALFFIGGYVFYGALYAGCGAMTDKDNENQGYMTVLTLLLLGSFYIEMYAVDNTNSVFSIVCSFIPFTAPAVGTVGAVSGDTPLWVSILSLLFLYLCAAGSLIISGKIYTSSLLLRGRRFNFKDILLFMKSR